MTATETKRGVNATVHIDGLGCQGMLVPGGLILTATHCIQWTGEGRMALGTEYLERVTTPRGARFRVQALAADALSDLAVLGTVDDQALPDDADAFEQWWEATPAVPLATTVPRYRRPLPVQILSHKRKWIKAKITRFAPPLHLRGKMFLEAEEEIEGGTSGSPVVDSSGRLVGIVSNPASLPIVQLALPRWVLMRIRDRRKG
jgi:Trypsin-like peptidase domain